MSTLSPGAEGLPPTVRLPGAGVGVARRALRRLVRPSRSAVMVIVCLFGSVLAMGLPIGTALMGIGIGTSILVALSNVFTVPEMAQFIGLMIGLGVGIDYALLIVTRYREQLHGGHSVRESIAIAMDTAGRSVLFAGTTVVISLLGMLLIGLTFWQWFKSCISHGSHAIWLNIPLMQQVKLPAALFPCTTVVSDTVKFLFIFAVLLVILWSSGYPPWWGYVVLPLLFLVQLLLATACCLIAAAIVPFVPDVRFVIENALMALMFVSGVVFSLDAIEEPVSSWLALNPMVGLIESGRSILMHQQLPDWSLLTQSAAGSVLVMLLALLMLHRLAPRYPKLVI